MKKVITSLIFLAAICANAQIPSDSLVGFWPFNKNADDESGNGRNAIVNGPVLVRDRFNNDSSAYYFDGNSDYMSLSTSGLPDSMRNNYTISVWMKPDSNVWTSGWRTMVYYGNNYETNGTVELEYEHYSSTQYRLTNASYANGLDIINPGALYNKWNHVVGTYDGLNRKLYLDGHLIGEDITADVYVTTMNEFLFGRREHSFEGALDDIRIYSRAMDSTEIAILFDENPYIHYDTIVVFDTTHIIVYDTIAIYDTITVSDTLIIDVTLTNVSPPDNTNTIKVYPNPAKDILWINTGDYLKMNSYTVRIVNSSAQIVWNTTVTQQQYSIDLNTFGGTGIYFMQIYDDANTMIEVKKILLE